MSVGWLRMLGIILDSGFCTGGGEIFLALTFVLLHTKALKAVERIATLRKSQR